jgi:hypothetical protein
VALLVKPFSKGLAVASFIFGLVLSGFLRLLSNTMFWACQRSLLSSQNSSCCTAWLDGVISFSFVDRFGAFARHWFLKFGL